MNSDLRVGLRLVLLCLLFGGIELSFFHFSREPLAISLDYASSGPLATRPEQLVDRLTEWSATRPEFTELFRRLASLTLLWALGKHLFFPALVLAELRDQAWRLTRRKLFGMVAQEIYLALLAIPLLFTLGLCALGLNSSDPWVYRALFGVFGLWGMLKVSRDRSWTEVWTTATAPHHPKLAFFALISWAREPGRMFLSWLLWLAQIAAATGPLWEQMSQRPGPAGPQAAFPYLAASLLFWGLRLWLLHNATKHPTAARIAVPAR